MKYLIGLIFCFSILFLGFIPQQDDFALIVAGFAMAFASYAILVNKSYFKTRDLIIVGIALRIILIFAFPNLSDDIYRFIWDGQMLHLGENPFKYLPSEYLQETSLSVFHELYPKLNSPEYYSVYPPFAQFIFYLSTFSFFNPAMAIKVMLLIAEITSIYFGVKLLRLLQMTDRDILWYALNPLIIIEIMGNIHFEGFMVCFFVLFMYFLKKKAINKAALFIALSISAKLIPLLFLPYFLFKWPLKKTILFYLKVGGVLLLFFIPMIFQFSGFSDSLDLYFRKFEFNASIYYILRAIGTWWKGYNMIASLGPLMAIMVFLSVLYLAYRKKEFIDFSMASILIFLLMSTTVHPWYTSLGVILSVFSFRKYFILWSFVIVLSYSKYGLPETLHYYYITLEYTVLLVYFVYEFKRIKDAKFDIGKRNIRVIT